MANDADWVEDVRRWYYGGNPPATDTSAETSSDERAKDPVDRGYESAQPTLQKARRRPDAPPPQIDKPS
jgi:hypothetical protein